MYQCSAGDAQDLLALDLQEPLNVHRAPLQMLPNGILPQCCPLPETNCHDR